MGSEVNINPGGGGPADGLSRGQQTIPQAADLATCVLLALELRMVTIFLKD